MSTMHLNFEFYTSVVGSVGMASRHDTQEEAWVAFHGLVANHPAFATVVYLDLTDQSAPHLLASFQRHDGDQPLDELCGLALQSVETLRDLDPAPGRFKLGAFWREYGERAKRIPKSEIPFAQGPFPPAHLHPGVVLQQQELLMRRARLGVPASPGGDDWIVIGDGSMSTTGRYRLIPYERILQEPT